MISFSHYRLIPFQTPTHLCWCQSYGFFQTPTPYAWSERKCVTGVGLMRGRQRGAAGRVSWDDMRGEEKSHERTGVQRNTGGRKTNLKWHFWASYNVLLLHMKWSLPVFIYEKIVVFLTYLSMKRNYEWGYDSLRSFVNYEYENSMKTLAQKSNQHSRDDIRCISFSGLFDNRWLLLEELMVAKQRLGEGGKCDVIFLAR